MFKALEFLKSSGHPDYEFFDSSKVYEKRCKESNKLRTTFADDDDVEPIVERDSYMSKIENNQGQDEFSDEDEEYKKKDSIRKFQFDYDTSVCLVDKYPEAAVNEESATSVSDKLSLLQGKERYLRAY